MSPLSTNTGGTGGRKEYAQDKSGEHCFVRNSRVTGVSIWPVRNGRGEFWRRTSSETLHSTTTVLHPVCMTCALDRQIHLRWRLNGLVRSTLSLLKRVTSARRRVR